MSLVETAIGNLTTAIDTLVAQGANTDPNDAADAALIDAQTARVVAATGIGTAPAGSTNTIPVVVAPGNAAGVGVIS